MTLPPTLYLSELGPKAQMMAKHCTNDRLAMTLHYVAIGPMIVMAGAAAIRMMKDLSGHSKHHWRSE